MELRLIRKKQVPLQDIILADKCLNDLFAKTVVKSMVQPKTLENLMLGVQGPLGSRKFQHICNFKKYFLLSFQRIGK